MSSNGGSLNAYEAEKCRITFFKQPVKTTDYQ